MHAPPSRELSVKLTTVLACGLAALSFPVGCHSPTDGSIAPLLTLEQTIVFWNAKSRGDWTLDALVEDVWFESADGTCLNGWYAAASQPRAVVLFMHGNAGNITDLRPVLRVFRDRLNCSILVFDYRGYGRSDGHPSEPGVCADARAARSWLAKKTSVPETAIVLVGHSLGGGVAVDLAAREGARGLVLQSTFSTLPDAAQSHVPVRSLMHMKFDSMSKISHYHGPLLQSHGDADRVIPYALGCKLFAAANEPKEFITIAGGGHSDLLTADYVAALDHFLASLPQQ